LKVLTVQLAVPLTFTDLGDTVVEMWGQSTRTSQSDTTFANGPLPDTDWGGANGASTQFGAGSVFDGVLVEDCDAPAIGVMRMPATMATAVATAQIFPLWNVMTEPFYSRFHKA
jgi:hypothetical protein